MVILSRITLFFFLIFPSISASETTCDLLWQKLKSPDKFELIEPPYFEIPTFGFDVKRLSYLVDIEENFKSEIIDKVYDDFPNTNPLHFTLFEDLISFPERKNYEICNKEVCSKKLKNFIENEEYLTINQILFKPADDYNYISDYNVFNSPTLATSTYEIWDDFTPSLNFTFISHIDDKKISEYTNEELYKILYTSNVSETRKFRFQISEYEFDSEVKDKNSTFLELVGYFDMYLTPKIHYLTPQFYEFRIRDYPDIDTVSNSFRFNYDLNTILFSKPLFNIFKETLTEVGEDWLIDEESVTLFIEEGEYQFLNEISCSISLKQYKENQMQFWITVPEIWNSKSDKFNDENLFIEISIDPANSYVTEIATLEIGIHNAATSVENKFDLHTFPFDAQKFIISIADPYYKSAMDISPYIINNIDSTIFDYEESGYEQIYIDLLDDINWTFYKESGTDEFLLTNINQNLDMSLLRNYVYSFSPYLNVELTYKRLPNYYFYKIFLPVFVLFLISLCSFFIPYKEIESKLTLTVVIFLALIAYIFVIDENIPKLSYMTLLDYFVLISFIFTSLPIAIAIFGYKMHINENILINKFKFIPLFTFLLYLISISYIFFYHSKNFKNASGFLKNFS